MASRWEQIELDLGVPRVPWGGVSPRLLTKAYKRFSFTAGAEGRRQWVPDPLQLDLFDIAQKDTDRGSAPTLLPLPALFKGRLFLDQEVKHG